MSNNYPDGLGAEICGIETLKKLYVSANSPEHREHLFNYIWENSDKFRIKTFDPSDHFLWKPKVRLDLDTYSDYKYLQMRPFRVNMTSRQIISTVIDSDIKEENYETS